MFKTKIICTTETREQATTIERRLQKSLNVVKSSMYINMSIATPNGFFGMEVSGKDHPNFGLKRSEKTLQKHRKPKTDITKTKIGFANSKQYLVTWPLNGTFLPDPNKTRQEIVSNMTKFIRDNPEYKLNTGNVFQVAKKNPSFSHCRGFVIEKILPFTV